MEDNKELKENTELDDEQAEDVSGGTIYYAIKENCIRCGKSVGKYDMYNGLCRGCRNKEDEGKPLIMF